MQLAKALGARVLATTATESVAAWSGEPDCDTVFDRRTALARKRLATSTLCSTLVGSDAVERSWGVLAPGGAIATVATMDIAAKTPAGKRGVWLSMKGDPERLAQLAADVAAGVLRSTIAEVVPLAGLASAILGVGARRAPGKVVVDLTL